MACYMDFHLYPFDSQLCPVEFESYGHTTSDIIFKWIGERSIIYADSITKRMTLGEYVLSDKYINPTCVNEYRFGFTFYMWPIISLSRFNSKKISVLVIIHVLRDVLLWNAKLLTISHMLSCHHLCQ